MNRLLIATAAIALTAGGALAQDVRLGVSLGFTGPLESMAPSMLKGAELAAKEASDSGKLLDGGKVTIVQADNTCADAAASVTAVERLVTADKVNGIVGGMCSGETIASLEKVAVPNGMVMISPSATSPALSTIDDKGFFFRTAPSDARQGEVMADIITERGIKNVAVTYTNNDYGKGLADSFANSYKEKGGSVTMVAAHDDGKADYSAEVAALAAAGGEALGVRGVARPTEHARRAEAHVVDQDHDHVRGARGRVQRLDRRERRRRVLGVVGRQARSPDVRDRQDRSSVAVRCVWHRCVLFLAGACRGTLRRDQGRVDRGSTRATSRELREVAP